MPRLHLVGFTTDLKNLVLATRKGAKSGNYLIAIDDRLRRTLKEVDKLESDDGSAPSTSSSSRLTPKEIQALLRAGKSVEQVARMAETEVEFIDRFTGPIMAERRGVIDQVMGGRIAKRRLGPSAVTVGDAIQKTLKERKVPDADELLEEGWDAVKKADRWEVRFRYSYRGSRREAVFAYDPEERTVEPLNNVATDIAWRETESVGRPKRKPAARKPTPRKKPPAKKKSTKSRGRGRR